MLVDFFFFFFLCVATYKIYNASGLKKLMQAIVNIFIPLVYEVYRGYIDFVLSVTVYVCV